MKGVVERGEEEEEIARKRDRVRTREEGKRE